VPVAQSDRFGFYHLSDIPSGEDGVRIEVPEMLEDAADIAEEISEKEAAIEAVTIKDIKDAFARRINPDKLITVMVGPDEPSPMEAN